MFPTNGSQSGSNRLIFKTGDQAVQKVDKRVVNGKPSENGKPLV